MEATGIIRRIDDLGRIAIPKALRQEFNFNEGEALEFFKAGDTLIIRKYNPSLDQEIYDALNEAIEILDNDGELSEIQEILSSIQEKLE